MGDAWSEQRGCDANLGVVAVEMETVKRTAVYLTHLVVPKFAIGSNVAASIDLNSWPQPGTECDPTICHSVPCLSARSSQLGENTRSSRVQAHVSRAHRQPASWLIVPLAFLYDTLASLSAHQSSAHFLMQRRS